MPSSNQYYMYLLSRFGPVIRRQQYTTSARKTTLAEVASCYVSAGCWWKMTGKIHGFLDRNVHVCCEIFFSVLCRAVLKAVHSSWKPDVCVQKSHVALACLVVVWLGVTRLWT